MYKVVKRDVRHAPWCVVRTADDVLICCCEYKRGAIRVMNELEAIASGQKRYIEKGDIRYEG